MIALIAAVANNNVIGLDGKIPWHLSDDLKRFRRLTTGNTVIMGRKTFESIGGPLPDRYNIVVSKTMYSRDNVLVKSTLDEAIKDSIFYDDDRDIFIIGGAELYREALKVADTGYLTLINSDIKGDVCFPEFDYNQWDIISTEVRQNSNFEYAFLVINRKSHAA